MNTTQKMIAAVAIVAVLAVAAVGAGFAYTASTSNEGNTASQVYFTLDQGELATSYSDSFDISVTYDTVTTIEGDAPKTVMTIADVEKSNVPVDIEIFKETEDGWVLATEAQYEDEEEAFATAYNAEVAITAADVDEEFIAGLSEDLKTALADEIEALETSSYGDTEKTAFVTAYNAEVAITAADVNAAFIESLSEELATALADKIAAYEDAKGKAFNVAHGEDTTIPQYTFTMEKIVGEIDQTNYTFIVGVLFDEVAEAEFKELDGNSVTFESATPGAAALTLGFYLIDNGTAGPGEKAFEGLGFTFTVENVA